MLLAIALTLISQTPASPAKGPRPVAVFATSKRPQVDQYIAVLTARAHALLKREGVSPLLEESAGLEQLKLAGVTDPRGCQGGRACVARMAVILGPRAVVVGIDVGKAGASLAVIMEAVAADTGQPLHTSEFEVPIATYGDASALPVTLFARELKAKLDAENPAPAKAEPVAVAAKPDAPLKAKLEPEPVAPPQVVVKAPGVRGTTVAGVSLVVGGVVGVGVSTAFALIGASAKAQIDGGCSRVDDVRVSCSIPRARLNSLAAQTNDAFTASLISAIIGGVLAATGVILIGVGS